MERPGPAVYILGGRQEGPAFASLVRLCIAVTTLCNYLFTQSAKSLAGLVGARSLSSAQMGPCHGISLNRSGLLRSGYWLC
jgi:hypothetical protein